MFGFCESFEIISKSLRFELELRFSNRKQDILSSTLTDNVVNDEIANLSLYIPTIFPSPETQRMFNEAPTKNFILSYESLTTDRKPIDKYREFQVDIFSASNIHSPLYLISPHQRLQRPGPAARAIIFSYNRFNNAFFANVDVKNTMLRLMELDIQKIQL